jgi:mono/diheme cytochrome c family protein
MTPTSGMTRRRRIAVGLAVALTAAGLAGCQADGPDPAAANAEGIAAGKALFTGACGGCHVLEDAGTEGRTGPNLDDAFRGARLQGWKNTQFEGVVRKWILISRPPMPQNIVVGEDAENVSAYVAAVAGTSPESVVRGYEEEQPEVPEVDANAPAIDGSPKEAAETE